MADPNADDLRWKGFISIGMITTKIELNCRGSSVDKGLLRTDRLICFVFYFLLKDCFHTNRLAVGQHDQYFY